MEAELAITLATGWVTAALFFVALCAGAKRGA